MSASRRSRATALTAAAAAAGMVGMAYAAVPLYDLFCRVTGFGGTPNVAAAAPGAIGDRVVTVEFDANTAANMPWEFRPVQPRIDVRVGEPGLAFYEARNPTGRTIAGRATFNVVPLKAGRYFSKVQCFCFNEQVLEPGRSVEMGVAFFVDPAILDNPDMDDVDRITLSYTFFASSGGAQADLGAAARRASPEAARTGAASPAGGRL